jgi:carbonic anhydrase
MAIEFSRRGLFWGTCCGASSIALGSVAVVRASAGSKTELTPDQALVLLKKGNRRFVSDSAECLKNLQARRVEIAGGQTPVAAVVACSDSRVPPELLFGRGLGELFVIRDAGNTVDTVGLGSIQYAVEHLGVPLVVVLGHRRCGAVQAAVAVVQENATFPGSIGQMVEPIVPAVLQARSQEGDLVENAVRENVRRTVTRLRTSTEPILLKPLHEARLRIVGARYDLDDGNVDWFMES